MTYIRYKCRSEDAQKEVIVNTLKEANAFVEQYGGSYELINENIKSDSEPYTRPHARARVYQRMH